MMGDTSFDEVGLSISTVSIYFSETAKTQPMTGDEEYDVATRFRQTGSRSLANKLVKANLRFVVKVALEYRNYGFPIMDLVQEGNVGLLKAVDRFDPEKGFRLISYGVWWIRAQIQEYILKNWSLVKIGTTQLQRRLFNNLQSAKKRIDRLIAADSEDERVSMLADEVGGTVEDVLEMQQRLNSRDVSLDMPLSSGDGDNNLTLMSKLSLDDGTSAVEDIMAEEENRNMMEQRLHQAISMLAEREREILTRRHLSESPCTLKELGEEFGISKERIRQLENRAMKQLRRTMGEEMAQAI